MTLIAPMMRHMAGSANFSGSSLYANSSLSISKPMSRPMPRM